MEGIQLFGTFVIKVLVKMNLFVIYEKLARIIKLNYFILLF
jgi:hypothetical protein